MTSPNLYFVKATAADNFALCEYFTLNDDGSYTQVKSPLSIPSAAASCNFQQHPESTLTLQAAVFKTLPVSSTFKDYNYSPIASNGQVAVSMPVDKTVTKGVVLMFNNADGSQLYSSTDPEVRNDE